MYTHIKHYCRDAVAGGRTGRVSGVLCDRKMNVKIKGKVYRTRVVQDSGNIITGAWGRDIE